MNDGEVLYYKAVSFVDDLGLNFTFRSIEWILKNKKMAFSQLRSCIYVNDGQAYFDYVQSVSLIIQCGLIGSNSYKKDDFEGLENKAYDIIEDFRSKIGFIGLLHIVLINKMEELHFFMIDTDVKVLEHMSCKNLQKELAVNLLREDLEEKTRQAQALSQ